MKKKIKNAIIIFFLSFIIKETLLHSELIIKTVNNSLKIWINNIVPSLFPFMIISDLLINYGFVEFISNILNSLFKFLFKTKKEASFVFIMSILSGSPSNASYLKELYVNNKITGEDITKIILFCHFSNPLFILGTVSTIFLMNKELGLCIFISQVISNILIGIIFRKKNISSKNNKYKLEIKKNNLVEILQNSILKSINTLFLILGILTICMILTTIISENIHLSPIMSCFISGFLEMTQGLKCVSLLSLNIKLKTIMMSALISFGGISIHLQIRSILNNLSFNYKSFLIARIMQAVLSSFITYILL